ncbi:MAG TPA: bifunctional phosphoribosylaminoimidazolecarboxamide formyltransferase/IMP cyclohydrolase [Actinomycetota bacterium]|jgi:phosphoribosylaminoimidazolecarboxamide formyltransferase/IMP cyclohydrolase
MPAVTVRRALLSVSDKSGIVELARGLVDCGYELVSSGGTAKVIAEAGVPVKKVADVTGAPEILGGRVKTLHPKIHGGILADRTKPDHMQQLDDQGIVPIDLVVCNLYPFERTIAHPSIKEADAVEQIDIGGPAMVRAAAKNFLSVAVVVNPAEYGRVLEEIKAEGDVSAETRRRLAHAAFQHTGAYDAAIARYLMPRDEFPDRLVLNVEKVDDLRYGENPHQVAAFYRNAGPAAGLAAAEQLHGKGLSYNNLLDTDAAWRLVAELESPAAAIIKHSNPCGAALGTDLASAYAKALECDRTSAFGGIVALNAPCDGATAEAIAEVFTEVVIAPAFDDAALAALTAKKNLRILKAASSSRPEIDVRRVAGGMLVQSADPPDDGTDAKVVTRAQPTEEQWADLRFAWIVAKHVKSNAIVLAKDQTAVGVGAGQMSRVESTELAARRAGERARGTVCASDAFFPFRDGLDAAVAAGAVAVIQPGGSVRDEEVIAAADEHGIPMLFTGRRHFRH